ncbi:MAG: ABC transporter permease [Acidothermus sp.]|nr:ABC transporter permease [Acidothermus sp.]
MLAYTIRRLLVAIPLLIVSTFVVFLLVTFSGDPLANLRTKQPPPSPQVIANYRHMLRLDQPVLVRYWHWVTGLLHGDFGPSVQGGGTLDIGHALFQRILVSLRLVIAAIIIAMILAVIVGTISAVRQYSIADYVFTFTGFLFLSLPVFWFALLLKEGAIWLNNHIGTGFKTLGESSPIVGPGFGSHLVDALEHLVLPTITLALTAYAAWSRFNRSSMLEVLGSDYVRLARAKGLSRSRVLIRHALRTALIPFVTVTALDIAALLSQTIITETVFQWRGMGDFLFTAIRALDVYAVLAWLLFAAIIVIVANLIADLLYAVLDPRIRYD